MFQLVAKIILHFIWLIPLAYGRIYFTFAAALSVAIFYIKSFKLAMTVQDLEAKGLGGSRECESLKRHQYRWRRWTFLPGRSP